VNLYLKDVLKCTDWSRAMGCATAAAAALIASSSKWLNELIKIVVTMYGRPLVVMGVTETRWNSIQMCLASQLRIQDACTRLAYDHRHDSDFPAACRVYVDESFWAAVVSAE